MPPDRTAEDGRGPVETVGGERLVFLHVPKTAGTSVRTYLERHFPHDQVLRWYPNTYDDLRKSFPAMRAMAAGGPTPAVLERKRMFVGHFTYGTATTLAPGAAMVTMLRRPEERLVSSYHQWERGKGRRAKEGRPSRRNWKDIDDFVLRSLEDPRLLQWDLQTRMLTGPDIFAPSRASLPDRNQALAEGRLPRPGPGAVEECRQRLRRMACFGIKERFEESMLLFAATFGWRPPSSEIRLNVRQGAAKEAVLAEAVIDGIQRTNRLDNELYAWARTEFDARFQALCDELAPGLEGPAAIDGVRAKLRSAYGQRLGLMPVVESCFVRPGDVGFTDGWHEVEAPVDGRPFRWIGPHRTAGFLVPLDRRKPIRIRVLIGQAILPRLLAGVTIATEGQPLATTVRRQAGGGWVAQAVLPARVGPLAEVPEIQISIGETVRPADIDPANSDVRALGLAVEGITFDSKRRPTVVEIIRTATSGARAFLGARLTRGAARPRRNNGVAPSRPVHAR